MDQLREGINLRAYGQKNPLLEYKSEGFQMFKDMMASTTKQTLQRLFRTQLQGVRQEPAPRLQSTPINVRLQHSDATGMGLSAPSPTDQQPNRPQQATKIPIRADKKFGRNEKIKMVSPSGELITIKYKNLQIYLKKGYTQSS